MAAPRYLVNFAGGFVQTIAAALGGAGQGEKLVSTNTSGVLDVSFFPAGIGAEVITAPASEALSAGAMVNIWTNGGVANVRNADASAANGAKACDGFVQSAVASGASATVYAPGLNTGLTGQSPGVTLFLATTPGGVTATEPTAAGTTSQRLGKAITATSAKIDPQPWVGNT